MFQSSFELTGYITGKDLFLNEAGAFSFQSSFELTGYITPMVNTYKVCYAIQRFKALSSLQVI